MTDRELLKQALDALTVAWEDEECSVSTHIEARKTIAAIKKRLAQPEQEPVAWVEMKCPICGDMAMPAPPQLKPLEGVIDIKPIGYHSLQLIFKSQDYITKFKAAHGIKE